MPHVDELQAVAAARLGFLKDGVEEVGADVLPARRGVDEEFGDVAFGSGQEEVGEPVGGDVALKVALRGFSDVEGVAGVSKTKGKVACDAGEGCFGRFLHVCEPADGAEECVECGGVLMTGGSDVEGHDRPLLVVRAAVRCGSEWLSPVMVFNCAMRIV